MTQDSKAGSLTGVRKLSSDPRWHESCESYWANKCIRLMTKTAYALHYGTDSCLLNQTVAMQMDACRYRGPVAFWNRQLLDVLGFAKHERLDRARKRSIEAGWLLYRPGNRHRAGQYRVVIPAELQSVETSTISESVFPPEGYQQGYEAGFRDGYEAGLIESSIPSKRTQERVEPESVRIQDGQPSYLCPKPDPSPPPLHAASDTPSNSEPAGDADQWAKVEEELILAGVSRWRALLGHFRESGCSAEHALKLIEFWKQHRDRFDSPVGALHHRLENAHPSIPADERWPGLQANPKPKTAPDIDIGRYTAAWSKTRPSQRAVLARRAQIDLKGFEGQGLRELPGKLRIPIVELLAREAGDRPFTSGK
jgi:hypothetical protein